MNELKDLEGGGANNTPNRKEYGEIIDRKANSEGQQGYGWRPSKEQAEYKH